jgi:hypothetical protein
VGRYKKLDSIIKLALNGTRPIFSLLTFYLSSSIFSEKEEQLFFILLPIFQAGTAIFFVNSNLRNPENTDQIHNNTLNFFILISGLITLILAAFSKYEFLFLLLGILQFDYHIHYQIDQKVNWKNFKISILFILIKFIVVVGFHFGFISIAKIAIIVYSMIISLELKKIDRKFISALNYFNQNKFQMGGGIALLTMKSIESIVTSVLFGSNFAENMKSTRYLQITNIIINTSYTSYRQLQIKYKILLFSIFTALNSLLIYYIFNIQANLVLAITYSLSLMLVQQTQLDKIHSGEHNSATLLSMTVKLIPIITVFLMIIIGVKDFNYYICLIGLLTLTTWIISSRT